MLQHRSSEINESRRVAAGRNQQSQLRGASVQKQYQAVTKEKENDTT